MTESVIADMLSIVHVNADTRIDVKKFYKDYRAMCNRIDVQPLMENLYFYRACRSYNDNLWLEIGDDNKPYWVYRHRK